MTAPYRVGLIVPSSNVTMATRRAPSRCRARTRAPALLVTGTADPAATSVPASRCSAASCAPGPAAMMAIRQAYATTSSRASASSRAQRSLSATIRCSDCGSTRCSAARLE